MRAISPGRRSPGRRSPTRIVRVEGIGRDSMPADSFVIDTTYDTDVPRRSLVSSMRRADADARTPRGTAIWA